MSSCPKCASINLQPVNGQRVVPPGAHPPSRKHTLLWAIVALVFALTVIVIDGESRGVETVLLMLAIGGTAAAQRAHVYNVRDLPVRESEHRRKMFCARCGEVLPG
jgi:hypothetical protein